MLVLAYHFMFLICSLCIGFILLFILKDKGDSEMCSNTKQNPMNLYRIKLLDKRKNQRPITIKETPFKGQ